MTLVLSCKEIDGCFIGAVNISKIVDVYIEEIDCMNTIRATTTLGESIVLCKSRDIRVIKMLFQDLVYELSRSIECGIIDLGDKYETIIQKIKGDNQCTAHT